MREHLQPSYVLHRRPFRDSSVLLETFSAAQGRVSMVARGLNRRRHGGTLGALLQPFRPLLLSYTGRGELVNLSGAEIGGELVRLGGRDMLSGLYLNELLLRLLHRFVAQPALFVAYAGALAELSAADQPEPALRRFEFTVLEELGYGVDLRRTSDSGEAISVDQHYVLVPEQGFCRVRSERSSDASLRFPGRDLLAIADADYARADRRLAKQLARLLLQPHLGDRPLQTRAMFGGAVANDKGRSP